MYRFLVIGSVVLWVVAMTALVRHDVMPAWTAQDVPPVAHSVLSHSDRLREQYGLFNGEGVRLGTAWSEIIPGTPNTTVRGTATVAFSPLPEIRIDTETVFTPDNALDSFNLDVFGIPMTVIRVRGERRGIYFPCTLDFATVHRQANLDLAASRMIGDTLRPFSYLPTLKIGQSWRMQLLDPVSAAITHQAQFTSIVATVVGEETKEFEHRSILCKIVETSPHQVRAWVDPDGRVLLQEVDVPGLGKIRVKLETFDDSARESMQKRISSARAERGGRE